MNKGILSKMPHNKNFAFLSNEDGEYFFHKDDFLGHWEDLIIDYHQRATINLSFEPYNTEKGLRARNVRRTEFPNEG